MLGIADRELAFPVQRDPAPGPVDRQDVEVQAERGLALRVEQLGLPARLAPRLRGDPSQALEPGLLRARPLPQELDDGEAAVGQDAGFAAAGRAGAADLLVAVQTRAD